MLKVFYFTVFRSPKRRRRVYVVVGVAFIFGCLLAMRKIASTENVDEERQRKLEITRDDMDWVKWLDPQSIMDELRNKTNSNETIGLDKLRDYKMRILNDEWSLDNKQVMKEKLTFGGVGNKGSLDGSNHEARLDLRKGKTHFIRGQSRVYFEEDKKRIRSDRRNSKVSFHGGITTMHLRGSENKARLNGKIASHLKRKAHFKERNSGVHSNPIQNNVLLGRSDGDFNKELGAPPNYNVHIFYYGWYGNPKVDGKYLHWNHPFLPHWRPEIAQRFRKGTHVPPEDVGSNFYPELGPYSSRDIKVIHNHMKQLCYAGVGVLAVSWYPPGKADEQGEPSDSLVLTLLDVALMYDLRVTVHVEPYEGRNDETLEEDVKYIIDKYGNHKGFYKHKHPDGRLLPLLYIYDSYRTPAREWSKLLQPYGGHSIRKTKYDCLFIALVVEPRHKDAITIGGFDGLYTYFATNGFSYGSSWKIWPKLASFAKQTNSIFIPSVGPGYIDTNIRPWNSENTRLRNGGEYYTKSWKSALHVKPEIISITSFNEWHEGTQIEKAVPKQVSGVIYKDYLPYGSDYYLQLTRKYTKKFEDIQNAQNS